MECDPGLRSLARQFESARRHCHQFHTLWRKETIVIDTQRTLVLSQSYEPIKVVSWQRALRLLTLGKVEVLEEYDWGVRTTTVVIKMPAVVRLLRAFRRHRKAVK